MKRLTLYLLTAFLVSTTTLSFANDKPLPKPDVLDEESISATKPLSSYQTLVIKDFTLEDAEISNINRDDKEEMAKFETLKLQLVNILSDDVAKNLKEKNIFKAIVRNGPNKEHAIILEGKFLHIDAGHAALRFFIGGVGSSRILIKGKLVDATTGQELASFKHVRSSPLAWKSGESVLLDNVKENASDLAEFIEKLAK